MRSIFVLVAALLSVALVSCSPHSKPRLLEQQQQQQPDFRQLVASGDFGVPPKSYFRNTSVTSSTIDVAAALQSWAASYCAPGGGYSQYGTGPYCMNNCNKCACNANGDGSHTWCGYPYECVGYTWGQTNLTYGAYTTQPGEPFVISETFNNSLPVSQAFTFTKEASYTNEYSWTFSTTISDSMTVSVSASIPEIMSVSDSFTTSLDMTSSDTQTKTHTDSWSVSQQFTVPPNTAVLATMTLTTAKYNMPYTSVLEFQGVGYTWCNNKVQGHWCWFPWPANFLNFGGCYSNDGMNVFCPFAGEFYGLQGVEAHVTIVPI